MVIRFNKTLADTWYPATTDFTMTNNGGGATGYQTVVDRNIIIASDKYQNNTGTWSGTTTININTMFNKSGKNKFTLNCSSIAKIQNFSKNGNSSIYLTDGATTKTLITTSTNAGGTITTGSYASAYFTFEKISATQLIITRVDYVALTNTNAAATTLATETATFNTFSSLTLNWTVSVDGGSVSTSGNSQYRSCSGFPEFVTRFS